MKPPRENPEISETFTASADGSSVSKPQKKAKHPPPFSIRFTNEERARLEQAAGSLKTAPMIISRR